MKKVLVFLLPPSLPVKQYASTDIKEVAVIVRESVHHNSRKVSFVKNQSLFIIFTIFPAEDTPGWFILAPFRRSLYILPTPWGPELFYSHLLLVDPLF